MSHKNHFESSVGFGWANWLWAFLILCALTIPVPLIVLYSAPQTHLALPLVCLAMIVAYSGIRLSLLALEGREKLLNLTFWTFGYVWMGIAPLAQLSIGYFPWPGTYSNWILTYSSLIVLVGFIAYDVGSWLGGRLYYSRVKRGLIFPYSLSISKRRVYVLSFVAILLTAISIYKVGGLQLLFSARTSFEEIVGANFALTGALIWTSLLRAPAMVALALMLVVWKKRKQFSVRGHWIVWHMALLSLLLVLNLVVSNPMSTPRLLSGTLALTLMFLTLGWSRRHSFGAWVTGLISALLLVFPYTDIFRYEGSSLSLQPVVGQLSSADYEIFQQLANTIIFVSASGVTFGYQLLGALFFWVPRGVWPNKPYGSGQLVGEYLGYQHTNLSSPLWAEAYINAGLIGVILTLLLWGFVSSLLQNLYIASYENATSLIAVLVPILAAYQIFLLRGDLQNGTAYLVPIVAYLFLAGKVTRAEYGGYRT